MSAETTAVAVGARIPDFVLDGVDGTTKQRVHITNQDLAGKMAVVYFYPKDETPGCTSEACSFRDSFEDFKRVGALVIGISSDTVEAHQSFVEHHRLPFVLLADVDGAVRRKFGVPSSMFGILPGRVTYLFDTTGTCRYLFNSQMQAKKHVTETLNVIRSLQAPAAPAPAAPSQ